MFIDIQVGQNNSLPGLYQINFSLSLQ